MNVSDDGDIVGRHLIDAYPNDTDLGIPRGHDADLLVIRPDDVIADFP